MPKNSVNYYELPKKYTLHYDKYMKILCHYALQYYTIKVLSAPYLQLALEQDMACHLVDGGSHMQLEHPFLFRTNGTLNSDSRLLRIATTIEFSNKSLIQIRYMMKTTQIVHISQFQYILATLAPFFSAYFSDSPSIYPPPASPRISFF